MESVSRRWIESRSVGIAKLVAAATAPALEFDDAVAAAAMLDNLASTRGAAWAVLLRADGSTLARWRDPPAGGYRTGEEGIDYGAGVVVARVHVAGRTARIGRLAIGFDLAELQARRVETLRWLAMASAVVLVMGVAGAWLIGTIVARPLRRMTAVAERIADGDLSASTDLQTARRDEAGALARAFQTMLERLYEQRAALSRANGDLAEKLAQLKRTQEELVAADRRISLGRLAAGVAHEINNPLAYVGANLTFVAEWLAEACEQPRGVMLPAANDPQFGEARSALDEAAQGTERIRQIVKGLKTFSRGDDDRRETLQLTVPIEAAIAMAKHEIEQRACIRRDYGEAPPVLASEVRLSQVFLNLLINASHAIPEGELDRHSVTIATRTDASGFAMVEVTDTGSGMPPEVLAQLFHPFFTTKPAGVGTGLGLVISQDIVRAHGGRIEVESAVGRGSSTPATCAVARAASAAAPPARTSATLLVIDDEPLVGASLSRALGSQFEVVTLSSARQALDLLATGAFQHVLCDVMMPDMNGAAFHAELERRDHALASRVIFMTGGAFTPATEGFLSSWQGKLLEKPIDLDELRRAIHALPG
jgi:signal transduction histidine kinase/CheY-like chemotaxis protein